MGKEDAMWNWESLRIRKLNRSTYAMDGIYVLKQPIHDGLTMNIFLLNHQGGQFKKIFEKAIEKPCSAAFQESTRKHIEDFQAVSSRPMEWNVCPIPPLRNEVKNFIVEDHGILPPYIPGGEKWKIEIRMNDNETILGGFNLYLLVRSEKSLLDG